MVVGASADVEVAGDEVVVVTNATVVVVLPSSADPEHPAMTSTTVRPNVSREDLTSRLSPIRATNQPSTVIVPAISGWMEQK